jgi:hypothetical protein
MVVRMDAFELLQKKMGRAKMYERPAIILGVYKQLVYSAGRDRKCDGEYGSYAGESRENELRIGNYVYTQLERCGMPNSAKRLFGQLHLDLIE